MWFCISIKVLQWYHKYFFGLFLAFSLAKRNKKGHKRSSGTLSRAQPEKPLPGSKNTIAGFSIEELRDIYINYDKKILFQA